jgi:outer membrane protein
MKHPRPWLSFCLLTLAVVVVLPRPGWSQQDSQPSAPSGLQQNSPQSSPQKEGYADLVTQRVRSEKLSAPEHLRNYLAEGKLRLSLQDAVVLTLENNSQIRIQETQVESAKVALLGAHAPFDPLVTSLYNVNSSTFPPFSQLQGSSTANVNSTTQNAGLNYSETFWSGTNVQVGFTANNSFSNSSFYFVNPAITTLLSFQVTQPLLRNGWLFPNTAPLIIARRNLEESRAAFAAQVSSNVLQAVAQYWAVVEAQGNLEVAQRSQDAAETTYKRDKRALELGALPPLDIYRSESQVATRRVSVIQGEYALKQAEDALRMTIGADLDPYFQALDLQLTERPEPDGELRATDTASAIQTALSKRPEMESVRDALAADNTRLRFAHNQLLPELDLTASYASNGINSKFVNGNPIMTSSLGQLATFSFPTYYAQLSLTLPLKNRAAKAQLGSDLVERRVDLYTEEHTREQVQLDVKNAVHQLEQAKLSIAAGKEALELAKKNTAAEQRKYELGQGTIFLVLEAQTEQATAEQTLLQAQVGYQLAVAGLDYATGELLAPYHVQIADLTR